MFGNFFILDIYSFHSVQLWLGGLESLEIFSSPMLRPNFFPPTQQGGGNDRVMLYLASNRQPQSATMQKTWRVRFSKTKAQQELFLTPDHSIKECAKRKPYIKENLSSRKIIMNYKKLYRHSLNLMFIYTYTYMYII